MKSRPDGSPASLSRLLQRSSHTLKVYGTHSLGEGYAVSVTLREGNDGPFIDVRLTLAGHPTRRGIALLPAEVTSVAAILQRAADDIPVSILPLSCGGRTPHALPEVPEASDERWLHQEFRLGSRPRA